MKDLGSAYDWLKKISLTVRPIRITTQIWVVTHFCSRFSDVISRGETSRGVPKCRLFSQADMAACLPFCSSSAESRYSQRDAIRTLCKPPVVMHGINLNPLFVVDSCEISCSSSTLPSKPLFACLSLTGTRHPHNLRAQNRPPQKQTHLCLVQYSLF